VSEAKVDSLVEDYKRCFGTPSGKRVLFDLMSRGHILNANYTGDPNSTLFNEGTRFLVTHILKVLNIDSKKMMSLMKKQRQMQEEQHEYINRWSE
jgi:hypothetical protein